MVQTEMCKTDDYDQTITSWRPFLPPPYTRCTHQSVWRRTERSLCRPLPIVGSGPFIGRLRWGQEQQSSRSLFSNAVTAEHRALPNHHTASRYYFIRRNGDRIPIGRDRGILSIAANAYRGHTYLRITWCLAARVRSEKRSSQPSIDIWNWLNSVSELHWLNVKWVSLDVIISLLY